MSSIYTLTSGAISAALAGTNFRLIQSALAKPDQVVATAVGGTGNSYRYRYVAYGAGSTARSDQMTNPVSGPAPGSLSASVYLSMTPPVVDVVNLYHVFRESSNAPLTPGYIGTSLPGVEFRDTGIVATDTYAGPTSDTGSAGVYSTGPIVGTKSSVGNFGAFQFGPSPHAIVIGDSQSGLTAMGGFTGDGRSGIYFESISSGAHRLISRSTSSTDILRPIGVAGGTFLISSEQFIDGADENTWYQNSGYEIGLGSANNTLANSYGKHQFGVALGGTYATTSGGLVVQGKNWQNDALRNTGSVVLTDMMDFLQFRTGWARPYSSDDPANAEYAYGGWASGGTEYYFGTKAIGTGTLRSVRLTGASIILDTDVYLEGVEMTAPAAPAANAGRIFFQDNGAGKTQLMVIFSSGAAQQLAIQP